jgi:hypothetical protein
MMNLVPVIDESQVDPNTAYPKNLVVVVVVVVVVAVVVAVIVALATLVAA